MRKKNNYVAKKKPQLENFCIVMRAPTTTSAAFLMSCFVCAFVAKSIAFLLSYLRSSTHLLSWLAPIYQVGSLTISLSCLNFPTYLLPYSVHAPATWSSTLLLPCFVYVLTFGSFTLLSTCLIRVWAVESPALLLLYSVLGPAFPHLRFLVLKTFKWFLSDEPWHDLSTSFA